MARRRTAARYLDWRREQRVFTELGAWAPRGMTLAGEGGPERVGGAMASASFFRVMGASPVLGRYFSDDEDRKGGNKVAVISEGLWRRRFQAAPSALGANVQIDGEPYTVIGVAPASYSEIGGPRSGNPLGIVADAGNRGSNFLISFGRLRDGANRGRRSPQPRRAGDADDARASRRPIHLHGAPAARGYHRGRDARAVGAARRHQPAAVDRVHQRRQPLLLARAVVRERDLAIRASLGAGRRRLFGQVMGETVALGLLGSVAGRRWRGGCCAFS